MLQYEFLTESKSDTLTRNLSRYMKMRHLYTVASSNSLKHLQLLYRTMGAFWPQHLNSTQSSSDDRPSADFNALDDCLNCVGGSALLVWPIEATPLLPLKSIMN